MEALLLVEDPMRRIWERENRKNLQDVKVFSANHSLNNPVQTSSSNLNLIPTGFTMTKLHASWINELLKQWQQALKLKLKCEREQMDSQGRRRQPLSNCPFSCNDMSIIKGQVAIKLQLIFFPLHTHTHK